MYPGQLSLGQQRRLALARAFVGRPELLVLDEPFVSLDSTTAGEMLGLTEALIAETGPAVILVTHSTSRLTGWPGAACVLTENRRQLSRSARQYQLASPGGRVMTGLEISHVSHSYGSRKALDNVSFSVAAGRFCALLGPNGAGKSTLFALLTRLVATGEGHIGVAGFDIAREPRAALARIGVVFQQPTLDLDMTVRRNLRYFAGLHGLSGRQAAWRSMRP